MRATANSEQAAGGNRSSRSGRRWLQSGRACCQPKDFQEVGIRLVVSNAADYTLSGRSGKRNSAKVKPEFGFKWRVIPSVQRHISYPHHFRAAMSSCCVVDTTRISGRMRKSENANSQKTTLNKINKPVGSNGVHRDPSTEVASKYTRLLIVQKPCRVSCSPFLKTGLHI